MAASKKSMFSRVGSPMTRVVVSCLGSVRITHDDAEVALTAEQRELVALLVAAGTGGMTAEQLLDELSWVDVPSTGKQAAVMRVQRLRNKLPAGALTKGGQYAFDPEQAFVDVWEFDELARDRDGPGLEAAVALWGPPFHGLPTMTGRLQIEGQRLQRLYRHALELFGWTIAPGHGEERLSELLAELRTDPFNEALTVSAAAAIWRLNRQQEALEIITACRDELRDAHGLSASQQLDDIELAILNQDTEALAPRSYADAAARAFEQPIEFRSLSRPPRVLVGRHEEARHLTYAIEGLRRPHRSDGPPGRIVIITGEAGAGKSALVSTALEDLGRTQISIRVGAADESTSTQAYGAILDALPELRPTFERLTRSANVETGRPRFWAETLDCLRHLTIGAPTVLVLEDLHAADSQTAHLVRNLLSVALPTNLLIIATTRPPLADTVWSAVHASIEGDQVDSIELGPLDIDGVRELVASDHPDEPPVLQSDFADRVLELSRGNALVASLFSRDAPPGLNVFLLPDSVTPEDSLTAHLRSRVADPHLENLLSIAALIGQRFNVAVLGDLAGLDSEETFASLAVGEELGVCRPFDDDAWQFDHLLTMNYFSTRIPTFRPMLFARLSQREDVSTSSLVRYVTGAGDELPASQAVDALLSAADELKDSLAFSEATIALEYALDRSNEIDLDRLGLLIDLAECSSRSGAVGNALHFRQQAFDLAKERTDHDAMCRAALAGLPSGEFAGGEPDRLTMLDEINLDNVTSFSRPHITKTRLRQARICDNVERVRSICEEIDSSTYDGDTEGWAGVELEQLVFESLSRDARPIRAQLEGLAATVDPGPLRAEILHREVLAALIEQHADAAVLHSKVAAEVRSTGSPRTQWSMDVLSAALGEVGVIESSIDLEAARRSGIRWAIPDVFDSWGVQVWVKCWLSGDYESALALIEGSRGMIADNLAWHAGEALCAAHTGATEQMDRELDYILERLPNYREGIWASVVGALTAETAAICGRHDAAHEARATLAPHSGRSILLGIGAGHFGPVDRYLGLIAQTTGDQDPLPLFRQAAHQANQCGAQLWEERASAARDQLMAAERTR